MVGVGEEGGAVFFRDFSDEDGFHPAVAAEAHVAGAVADHHGTGEVDVGIVAPGLQRQSRFGLAARTAAAGQVGAQIYFGDLQSMVFQNLQEMAVYFIHILFRTQPLGYALLVGHDEDLPEIPDNERNGL